MKKILIVDPLSYSGHVNYNQGIIRAAIQNYDCDVLVNYSVTEKLINKGIPCTRFITPYPDSWNIEKLSKRMGKLAYNIAFRCYFLRVLLRVLFNCKKYDAVIITCIDVYAFAIISWLFRRKTLVIDHGIGRIKDSMMYRNAWLMINKNITIVVLENFIKDMVESQLPSRKVLVIRHPLPVPAKVSERYNKENKIIVFAPSASNDDLFLQDLKHRKIPTGIKIIAKSNTIDFTSENVIIYKGFLSKNDYDRCLYISDYILLAYEPSYNYRISAVLFEAIALGKKILLLSNNTLKNYAKIFSEGITTFTELDAILEGTILEKTSRIMYSGIELYKDVKLSKSIQKAIEY